MAIFTVTSSSRNNPRDSVIEERLITSSFNSLSLFVISSFRSSCRFKVMKWGNCRMRLSSLIISSLRLSYSLPRFITGWRSSNCRSSSSIIFLILMSVSLLLYISLTRFSMSSVASCKINSLTTLSTFPNSFDPTIL